MPRLSVLMATPGPAPALERTLASTLRHRPPGCEVVVVTNFAYDDPWGVAADEGVRFLAADPGAGWTAMVNAGLSAASGPVVNLLAAGADVAEGWTDAALERLAEGDVGAVAGVAYDRYAPTSIVTAGVRIGASGCPARVRARRAEQASRVRGLVAPDPVLGFLRRHDSSSKRPVRLDESLSPHAALADLGLRLRADGRRIGCEPAATAVITADTLRPPSGYSAGVDAVRLARRHGDLLAAAGSLRRLSIAAEVALSPLVWTWGLRSLGRLLESRRLAPTSDAIATEATDLAATTLPFAPRVADHDAPVIRRQRRAA